MCYLMFLMYDSKLSSDIIIPKFLWNFTIADSADHRMGFYIFLFSLVEEIKNWICHILGPDEAALLYSKVFIIGFLAFKANNIH